MKGLQVYHVYNAAQGLILEIEILLLIIRNDTNTERPLQ